MQDTWQRGGILIEGWVGRVIDASWGGIWTPDATCTEWGGDTFLWDRSSDPGEIRSALTPDDRDHWAAWIDALRDCAGEACRDAESSQ